MTDLPTRAFLALRQRFFDERRQPIPRSAIPSRRPKGIDQRRKRTFALEITDVSIAVKIAMMAAF